MADKDVPREFSALLPSEADRWLREGVISAEQRAAILKLYPAPGAPGRERTILIFTLLGSLLVGAGVILFFAANWPMLSATVKVGAILAAIVAAYGSGYYLQFRADYPRLGHSLIFLGSLFYGAGIWLVAQIFHLDTHFPTGFLLWGLGLLPVVLATGSVWVLYLATLVLVIWTGSEQAEFLGYNWLFPVLMIGAVAPLARRLSSALAEAGVLAGLFIWFMTASLMHLTSRAGNPEPFVAARMLILYGGALLTAGLARLGDERAYFGLGGAMALGGAYIMTFRWGILGQEVGIPALTAGSVFQTVGVFIILGAILAAAVLLRRRGKAADGLGLIATALVPVAAAFSVQFLATVPRMVTFNLLLFAGTLGWIVLGIRRRNQLVVNLGLAAFVVHVLTRYFDLFFNAMSKSLFFVVGGVLLLGGGWLLERNRRRWMGEWGGADDDK